MRYGNIIERRNLKEARRRRNWSQDRLAELMETRRETISDWERGVKSPDFYNREQLARLFRCTSPEELEILLMLVPDPKEETASSALLLPDFVRRNLSASLLCIAHTSYRAPSEMTATLRAAIEEFDTMNTGDATYQITRREALLSLAALPITTLGQRPTLQTKHYDEMLMHCTAALEACWQLYRGSDYVAAQHAFGCTNTYVPLLKTIAYSDRHHKEALDLAAHYALLQTMLSWKCVSRIESVPYAQDALILSRETGNISLELSACSKLNYTYLTGKQYGMALETMQAGEHVLLEYQCKKKNAPLLSGIIGNFYSGYAQSQIHNDISPDTALGIAADSEPLSEHVALTEFTAYDQWWEAAWVCSTKGDPKQAMHWLEKIIDPETLFPRPGLSQSQYDQIATLNTLAATLLQFQERDLEYIIETWTRAIEWAKAHRAYVLYEEALANFAILKALYPGECRIMKLIPLTSHW